MRKPLTILFTDLHLKSNNIGQIKGLIQQLIKLCIELNIYTVYCLGDVFDSRISQRLDVLKAFADILKMFSTAGVQLIVIPGNHDKTDYTSEDSFLIPFQHHPNFTLCNSYEKVDMIEGVRLHLMPFFKEDVWVDKFEPNFLQDGQNVLLTHMAFEGSINNDGTKVASPLKPKMFENFYLVLPGHYHNLGKISENIFHIPSIQQNNYGEDNYKGFTILYDNLTFEIEKSSFKEYKKFIINLNDHSKKDIEALIQEQDAENVNVRFEFVGNESKIKAIDKNLFINKGIEVKIKFEEIEGDIDSQGEITEYNMDSLKQEFKEFCKQEGIDYNEGIKYLN